MKLPSNKTIVSVAGLAAITLGAVLTHSPNCFWAIFVLILLVEKIEN